ncbi:helix-turn-helix domain-containing protein [Pseudomonas sp. LLC-1]|uniref:helix-turn-helix domain-containing protein n=1 Tax=Pseudomonas sp. LLC-1 TaxID=1812180 RepID=UPI002113FCF7|nr:helix-turn-helix domain-containing protein [Pseudomonas sp. LLC-1]
MALSSDLKGNPVNSRESLAAVLRVIRRARKLKAEQLAEGVTATHVANLENGKVSVTMDTLEAVANLLDVKAITLLALAAGLRSDRDYELVLGDIQAEIKQLDALGLLAEFSQEFEDGRLRSRPSGAQVSKARLAAVLECKASGLTQKETAEKLGIPSSTVQRHWQKG